MTEEITVTTADVSQRMTELTQGIAGLVVGSPEWMRAYKEIAELAVQHEKLYVIEHAAELATAKATLIAAILANVQALNIEALIAEPIKTLVLVREEHEDKTTSYTVRFNTVTPVKRSVSAIPGSATTRGTGTTRNLAALFEECATPEEKAELQALWSKKESGTITAKQYNSKADAYKNRVVKAHGTE